MKELLIIFSLASILVIKGNAQPYQKTNLGIKTDVKATGIEIQFYDPSTVRMLKWPEGKPFTKQSILVIKAPQKTDFNYKQQDDELSLKSNNLKILENLKNGKVSFENNHLINMK